MKHKVATQYKDLIKLESPNQTVIIDSNSKERFQNEVNQKEMLQLKKHFTKYKECQGRSHLIQCQARPSSKLCVFILCVV